jgi:hypothetical protein
MSCHFHRGTWAAASILAASDLLAQSGRVNLASVTAPPSAPSIQVVAAPDGAGLRTSQGSFGALDLGRVSWAQDPAAWGLHRTKAKDSFTVTTHFGLRLDCNPADSTRHGLVSAFLQQASQLLNFSVDGRGMTLSPAVISAAATCGLTTEHQLDITIPTSAPPGPIAMNLGFQATLR